MPRPRPRRDPCDCRDCLEGDGAAAAARGVGFLDGIVDDEKMPSSSATVKTSTTPSSPALTGTRAARQDPPPRALLLLCDGMLPDLIEEAAAATGSSSSSRSSSVFPHLDAVARGGAVGTLALRKEAEAGAEAEAAYDPRLRRHAALFQLLGSRLSPPPKKNNKNKKKKPQPLSERFLGLSAALVTTDAAAAAAAATEDSLGGLLDKVETFSVAAPPPEAAPSSSSSPLSSSAAALLASRVALLLGIDKPVQTKDDSAREEAEENCDGSFDLVFVHLTAEAFSSSSSSAADEIVAPQQSALSFADSFLRHVRSAPGALDDRGDDALVVVAVFSSSSSSGGGGEEEGEEEEGGGGRLALPKLSLPPRGGAPLLPPPPQGLERSCSTSFSSPVPRPAQSFEFAEGVRLETEDEALLVAGRCDGVLRVDGARRLLECGRRKSSNERSEKKSEKKSGNDENGGGGVTVFPGGTGLGCVLAEHLLDEMAYKLGRALKYGA